MKLSKSRYAQIPPKSGSQPQNVSHHSGDIKQFRYCNVTNIKRHRKKSNHIGFLAPGICATLSKTYFVCRRSRRCPGNKQELSHTCQLISSFTLSFLLVINPSRSAVSLYTVTVMAINLVSWLVVTKCSETKKSSTKITALWSPSGRGGVIFSSHSFMSVCCTRQLDRLYGAWSLTIQSVGVSVLNVALFTVQHWRQSGILECTDLTQS